MFCLQLERIARLEECQAKGNSVTTCEANEDARSVKEQQVVATKR